MRTALGALGMVLTLAGGAWMAVNGAAWVQHGRGRILKAWWVAQAVLPFVGGFALFLWGTAGIERSG